MRDFLQYCSDELRSSQRSCNEILQDLRKRGLCTAFLEQVNSMEGSLQNRLKHSVKQFQDPQLQNLVLDFSERFGTTSLEQQIQCFETLRQRCSNEYELQREREQQESKLILNLSICSGAAIVILLL